MQELGTALGYILLLAGSLANVLQAPLLHELQFQGSFSQLRPLQPQADAFALPRTSRAMQPKPLFAHPEPVSIAPAPEQYAPLLHVDLELWRSLQISRLAANLPSS